MNADCQAKIPLLPGAWLVCGQPATSAHLCYCLHGHWLHGRFCAAHEPAPGEVGCSKCFDEGHECTIETTPTDLDAAGLRCPGCGQTAFRVLGGGRQCFCGSDDCPLLIWDGTKSAAQNIAEMNTIGKELS